MPGIRSVLHMADTVAGGAARSMPPAINMPPPRVLHGPTGKPDKVRGPRVSAASMASIGSNMAFGAGTGAITGGLYTSDGLSLEGGIKGALGGAFVGGVLGGGMPALSASVVKSSAARKGMGASYSKSALQTARHLNTNEARRMMFAGGGLLGGALFGGGDSKRRGFNANRGTHIGHS